MNRQKKRFNKYLKDEQFRKWKKYLTKISDIYQIQPAVIGERKKFTYADIERTATYLREKFGMPTPKPVVRHFNPILDKVDWDEQAKQITYPDFYKMYFQEPVPEYPYMQSPIYKAIPAIRNEMEARRFQRLMFNPDGSTWFI